MFTEQQIKMAKKAGIEFPTAKPLFDVAPISGNQQRWLEKHNNAPIRQSIAKKIIDNINYISFATFLEQLKKVVAAFNSTCNEPYVLWIGGGYQKIQEGCSNLWVTSLALEHCQLRWPEAILAGTPALLTYLKANPKAHILYLDDASYTGTQLKNNFFDLLSLVKDENQYQLNLYLGIPYLSSIAIASIESIKSRLNYFLDNSITLLPHENIPLMMQLFTDEEKNYLTEHQYFRANDISLSYFQHRFPDEVSTFQNLITGSKIEERGAVSMPDNALPLVPPYIISPYKFHTCSAKSKLASLPHRPDFFGKRNDEFIPERYPEIKDLTDAFKILLDTIAKEDWKLGYFCGFFTGLGGKNVTINNKQIKVPHRIADIIEYVQNAIATGENDKAQIWQKVHEIRNQALSIKTYSRSKDTQTFYKERINSLSQWSI
ncbi:hypothetical protein ACFORL_06505 [Legionella dresdenensis]|uniref:Uncharacterized protein n=1 Tax=Legionella dresdenensis TaxID=450200 RepID=A0ABV8CEY6_9GAMM